MRSIYIYTLFALAGISLLSGCDTPPSPNSKVFLKYFGQDGFQSCVDLEVDTEGNFYMLGNNGVSADDIYSGLFMIKVDANGNLVWKQTIPPPSLPEVPGPNGLDAKDIELLSDGGLVVLANYYKTAADHDLFVGRYSRETGVERDYNVVQANNLYENKNDSVTIRDDRGSSITEITSGRKGFIIAGSANNLAAASGPRHTRDGIHVRLNESLVQDSKYVWKDVYGIGNENYETKVIQVSDDFFFSFGYGTKSDGSPNIDFNVVRLNAEDGGPVTMLDPSGDLGSADHMDRLGSVCFIGNTFFLAGIATDLGIAPASKLFVAKVALSGNGLSLNPVTVPTQPDYQLKYPSGSFTSSAVSRTGGFFVLTNEFLSGAFDGEMLLAKIGSDGSKLWGDSPPTFGGTGNDFGGAVRELPDGRIIVGGTISINGESKMALLKLNKNGQLAE